MFAWCLCAVECHSLPSWTVFLQLDHFPQYLACHLQHEALVRAQKYTEGASPDAAHEERDHKARRAASGVLQRLRLSDEELIHSSTPEQFLFAVANPR